MTQSQALEIMRSGANVFLTGPPGAGKTYVLNQFIEEAEADGKTVAITASTGLAASLIGGMTIHSWSGLGIREEVTKSNLKWYRDQDRFVDRFNDTDILVIDEVSMLHGFRLDLVNKVAKHLRGDPAPFGGMQVILVGDLFQLPPVDRENQNLHFVHLSRSWGELSLKCCYITEQHRQGADDGLLGLLQDMRDNRAQASEHLPALMGRLQQRPPDNTTRLYAHNADVDAINKRYLDALPGNIERYFMVTDGQPGPVEALKRNLLAPEELELKVGAKVMFVANNPDEGFWNGTQGKVVKFDHGKPVVRTTDNITIKVGRHTWSTREGRKVIAEAEQIPLRLAWAITIHKSQGMSLDTAEVDLSKAFTPGMGYVALSRVRSLDGLYLQGFNDMALTMHEQIYAFDERLRVASEQLTQGRLV